MTISQTLYEKAHAAIMELYEDTAVPREDARSNLTALAMDLDTLLETLEEEEHV